MSAHFSLQSAACRSVQRARIESGKYTKCVQSGSAVCAFHSARCDHSAAEVLKKGSQRTPPPARRSSSSRARRFRHSSAASGPSSGREQQKRAGELGRSFLKYPPAHTTHTATDHTSHNNGSRMMPVNNHYKVAK